MELLLVCPEPGVGWLAMAKPSRRLRPGLQLRVLDGPQLEVVAKGEDGHVIISGEIDPGLVAEQWGVMPLPPYIKQDLAGEGAALQDTRDRERYQTVYAVGDATGAASVAAPTAGLHFSTETLARLEAKGVGLARLTLHVGPGTFRPPTVEQINARRLHREFFSMPAEVSAAIATTRKASGRVIAVGTTSLRVLETVARLDLDSPGPTDRVFCPTAEDPDPVFTGTATMSNGQWAVAGQTRLFIRPPDRISAADGLLTNFHLPGSSLLMLVASLMGSDTWRGVYDHAIGEKLRFYSYGDCMLIAPGVGGTTREHT